MFFVTSDFDYVLPAEQIARYPLPNRRDSRLLILERGQGLSRSSLYNVTHHFFKDFIDWVNPGDLVVFNDTKVMPARLFGHKESGGQFECLIERILSPQRAVAHIRVSKRLKKGSKIIFAGGVTASVVGYDAEFNNLCILDFDMSQPISELLEKYGELALPPYLQRRSESFDTARYQTVFARNPGAIAAPTAALHFDASMLQQLTDKGIETGFVTLHVGAGTFQPVRVECLESHQMHKEYLQVPPELCHQINACKAHGGRVIAIGTTVVRALETAARQSEPGHIIQPYAGDTVLFIYPDRRAPYCFRCVDALLTNFHLPRSTLLMLVSAFGGYEAVMHAYQEAVQSGYRFFSYGDAMLLC